MWTGLSISAHGQILPIALTRKKELEYSGVGINPLTDTGHICPIAIS